MQNIPNPERMKKVIYYLDDDTDDLHFFKETAEELGHEVQIFVNGTVMLKTLKGKKLPDIIFLDIIMPVFNGEQFLDVLKNSPEWKHIPVVLISGAYSKGSVASYLDSGASYMMKKAVDFQDLRSKLKEILAIDWSTFRAYS